MTLLIIAAVVYVVLIALALGMCRSARDADDALKATRKRGERP